MKIRIVTPQEAHLSAAVSAVAFEASIDLLKIKREIADHKEAPPGEKIGGAPQADPLPSDAYPEVTWGAFNDEETFISSVVSVPTFTVRFHGQHCLLGGIGGVASLPNHRRGGGVRACMQAAIGDMYEKGYAFSYLYPFSRSYYRKFGYELCCELREYTLAFSDLKKFGVQGRVELLLPGSDFSVLTDIYNRHYEKMNLSVVRRDYDKTLGERNLLDEKRYVYVWYNQSEIPMGYLIFTKKEEYLDCTMNFGSKNDFVALDTQAYQGLLDFAQSFAANYKGIKFQVPVGVNLTGLLTEMNGARYTARYPGMARVIDVKKVLELAVPKEEGQLVLEIADSIAPWNEGCWLVTLSKKGNTAEKTDRLPDMSMDIGSFTHLICGCADFADTQYMPAVTVHNGALGGSLFYRQNTAILDLF